MSNRVLICASPKDLHVRIVAAALRGAGAEVEVWDVHGYPARHRISVEISNASFEISVEGIGCIAERHYDAIWLRRIAWDGHASSSSAAGHPMGLPELHSAIFLDRIFNLLPGSARWINRFENSICAEYKPKQLVVAASVGFRIPETLVSNDPRAIRDFVGRLGGVAVAKPLRVEYVDDGDGSFLSLGAEEINASHLARDGALESGPYIYQRKLQAVFEVRVTVIGEHVFSARIDASGGDELIDLHYKELAVSDFSLPATVRARCVDLGERLGLSFYCVDLVAGEDGEFYFLEVNQAGQFLWLEERQPEHPYLAAFCALLLGAPDPLPGVRLESILRASEFDDLLSASGCGYDRAAS